MSRPSLLDPKFRYVPAAATNVSKTFAKERRRLRDEAARKAALPEQDAKALRRAAVLRRVA